MLISGANFVILQQNWVNIAYQIIAYRKSLIDNEEKTYKEHSALRALADRDALYLNRFGAHPLGLGGVLHAHRP